MSPGRHLQTSRRLSSFVSEQKGLPRKHGRDGEEHNETQGDGSVQGSRKLSKTSRTRSSGFSCPFAKWDPVKYGGENGCTNYSRSIETVIRHHVLGKHRKEHEKASAGKEGLFQKVEELARRSGSSKQKQTKESAQELWRSMYKVLFEVESSEEENIPESSVKSNAGEIDVDNIHAHLVRTVSTNPLFPIEALDLIETVDMLRRERRNARHAVHQKAEKEIALIRDKEAAEIQQVDALYGERLRSVRSKLTSRLVVGSELHPGSGGGAPSMSSYDNEAGVDDLAPQTMQAPVMQANELASPSFTTPAELYDPHLEHSMFRGLSITSPSESALHALSDEGYQSRFGLCEHRILGDDSFCYLCDALFTGT